MDAQTVPVSKPYTGPRVWNRDTIKKSSWLIKLPVEVRDELVEFAGLMRRLPLPFEFLRPDEFKLPASKRFVDEVVKKELDEGVGIVVIDKFPVDEWTVDETRRVYWLFSFLLGRPISQKHTGNMMMDVRDTGVPLKAGTVSRGSTSNTVLDFHNDAANTPLPPKYVGLLMLHDAKAGGMSRALSVCSAYNWLLENRPEVVPRFYQDFKYFRMHEHEKGEPLCVSAPFFSIEQGELLARVGPYQMKSAFTMGEAMLDDDTAQAMAALDEVFATDELVADFYMERGQLQIVNNRVTIHGRTEFEDWPESERRRHLLRIWLRDHGNPAYNGT